MQEAKQEVMFEEEMETVVKSENGAIVVDGVAVAEVTHTDAEVPAEEVIVTKDKKAGKTKTKAKAKVDEDEDEGLKALRELQAQAENIAKVAIKQGLKARIDGTWVYITGDTKPCKELLKAMGCYWSRKHEYWYYKSPALPDGYRWDRKKHSFVKVVE